MMRVTWLPKHTLLALGGLLVSLMCISPAHADSLKAKTKQCKLGAKEGKKRCKVAQKQGISACKGLVKKHKESCKEQKATCKAEVKALRKAGKKKEARARVKCEVTYKICKVEAKADVKRCEQKARKEGMTCMQGVEKELHGCRSFFEVDTATIKGQCRATCLTDYRSVTPNCKMSKKFKKSTCALEHKLRTKDCKARKKLCKDENRVFKLLSKEGAPLPVFANELKSCSSRKKECEGSAREDLKLCRRALANQSCEAPDMAPCVKSCVDEAEAKAKTEALAREESERRLAAIKAQKEAKERAIREREEKLLAMPSDPSCRKHATKVYPELLKAVIDAIYSDKDNINKAYTTFEKMLRKRKRDVTCIFKSMKAWRRLAKPLNRMLQDNLPDAETEFERRLGTSGLALINDSPFSSLLDYTFNRYQRYLRR